MLLNAVLIYKVIKLTFFFLMLTLLAVWQYARPDYHLLTPLKQRWMRHFSLALVNIGVAKACFGAFIPLQAANIIEQKKIGLLQADFSFLPYGIKLILGVLLLDAVMYFQHRAWHRFSFAWRFHKVHHTDRELDLSTGLRFHPVEYSFSLAIKTITVVIIGAPILTVVLFELLLGGALLWSHTNIKLPETIEKRIRTIFVTPVMHRIHHSVRSFEHDCNFGFIFSFWDKLFSSYAPDSTQIHDQQNVGLVAYLGARYEGLSMLLKLPFQALPKKTSLKTKFNMEGVSSLAFNREKC